MKANMAKDEAGQDLAVILFSGHGAIIDDHFYLLFRGFRGSKAKRRNSWGMATRKSNVINFPQPIDPERKDDVRMAEQFFETIDGLVMESLRRDLAAAEARVLTADADAAEGVEFLCLSCPDP